MAAADEKRALRGELLGRRARRSPDHAADAERARMLLCLAQQRRTATVALYVATQGEPQTSAAISVLLHAGMRVLLPVLLPDRDLLFRAAEQVGSGGPLALVQGRLGLPVPPSTAPVVSLDEAGIVIVPALAVDRTGRRLGRGGGSYDRALGRLAAGAAVVAVVHPDELLVALPVEPHDRRVGQAFVGGELHELAG